MIIRNYLRIPHLKSADQSRAHCPMRNPGFTLLELLVVIGIIAVLVALATVSYSAAQKKSRDSRRQTDMKVVQGALEEYYTENSYAYPTDCTSVEGTYLRGTWPVDPMDDSASGYIYTKSCTASSYYVCAKLESGKGNSSASGPPTWAAGGGYFCVNNLQ